MYKYRVDMETDPPEPSSAAQDAHWLMLGDLILNPARRSNVDRRAASTRAQQEHERLSDEIREAVDKYDDDVDGKVNNRVFGHGTTVRAHMQSLEQKRDLLKAQILEEGDAEKRNRLEAELPSGS
jgi:hypothetical protein